MQDVAAPLMQATVDMFFMISNDLLPTPLKCHYTFNLCDPAKMLQGILMVHVKSSVNSQQDEWIASNR